MIIKKKKLFFFSLLWMFVAVRGLSLVSEQGQLFLAVASLVAEHRLQAHDFNSCSTQAWWLWCTLLVAPWHVGSSRTRGGTRVFCTDWQVPIHCSTREVLKWSFLKEIRWVCHRSPNDFQVLCLWDTLLIRLFQEGSIDSIMFLSTVFSKVDTGFSPAIWVTIDLLDLCCCYYF